LTPTPDGAAFGTTRLWLVRHGHAAAGWGEDRDPPLSPLGRRDAEVAADLVAPGGVRPVFTSPMLRTRQTADVLASRLGVRAVVASEVTEVPSPEGPVGGTGAVRRDEGDEDDDVAEGHEAAALRHRAQWLSVFLAGRWTGQPEPLWAWRRRLLGFLATRDQPSVVVTHAVAINTVLAEAAGDDRVFTSAVAPGSVTVVDVHSEPGQGAWSFAVVAVGAADASSRVW
jgi:broad specificity phosphatase PhoE